jgi:hypothetical protein
MSRLLFPCATFPARDFSLSDNASKTTLETGRREKEKGKAIVKTIDKEEKSEQSKHTLQVKN